MRILFTTFAWPSHYFPLVPVAWACRAAGHEVRMASQPELEPVIRRSGLPGVLVGHDVDIAGYHRRETEREAVVRVPAPPGEWDEARRRRALKGFGLFVRLAEAMVDDLVDFARDWRPDLVVSDPLSYAGPLCARLLGVPAVRNLFGPDIALDLEYQALAPLLSRYGAEDLSIYGALTLDPCPPTLQLPSSVPRQLIQYVPYNGLSEVPAWTLHLPPRRRICLTWGTSTTRLDARYTSWLPDVLKGLSEVDAEVVLAVTAAEHELLGGLPPEVRVATAVPLHALLPSCDLLVHQGGAGTTLTGLRCGLPQVVVAQLADQLVNASRIEQTGAGRCLIPDAGVAAQVSAAAAAVLGDGGYREAAGRLQQEMLAAPSPLAVVPLLERLARAEIPTTPTPGGAK
jgi:UDP:flavonoid glycosyltransferase YjiC (YdhE family)